MDRLLNRSPGQSLYEETVHVLCWKVNKEMQDHYKVTTKILKTTTKRCKTTTKRHKTTTKRHKTTAKRGEITIKSAPV